MYLYMTNLHLAHFDCLTRAVGPRRALPLHRLAQRSAPMYIYIYPHLSLSPYISIDDEPALRSLRTPRRGSPRVLYIYLYVYISISISICISISLSLYMTNLHLAHFSHLCSRALWPRRALPLHRLTQHGARLGLTRDIYVCIYLSIYIDRSIYIYI